MATNNEEKTFRVATFDYIEGDLSCIIHVPPFEGKDYEFGMDLDADAVYKFANDKGLNWDCNFLSKKTQEHDLMLDNADQLFGDKAHQPQAEEAIYQYLKEKVFEPIYHAQIFINKFSYKY